jgi:hypothetical protein
MSNVRVTEIISRLLSEPKFMERFRKDADLALSEYDLTDAETDAIKQGDQATLLHLGMDQAIVEPKAPSRPWFASMMASHAGRLGMSAAFVLMLTTASAGVAAAAPKRAAPGRRTAGARHVRMLVGGPSGLRRASLRAESARVSRVRARVGKRASFSDGVANALSHVCDAKTCTLTGPPSISNGK